jgi:hypothetical protein
MVVDAAAHGRGFLLPYAIYSEGYHHQGALASHSELSPQPTFAKTQALIFSA